MKLCIETKTVCVKLTIGNVRKSSVVVILLHLRLLSLDSLHLQKHLLFFRVVLVLHADATRTIQHSDGGSSLPFLFVSFFLRFDHFLQLQTVAVLQNRYDTKRAHINVERLYRS